MNWMENQDKWSIYHKSYAVVIAIPIAINANEVRLLAQNYFQPAKIIIGNGQRYTHTYTLTHAFTQTWVE